MKLQCSCGAKYAFDITPEMAQNPVRFVCPQCGADSSDFVNQLVRQELGLPPASVQPASNPVPNPAPTQAAPPPPAPAGSRLRLSHTEEPKPAQEEEAPVSKYCPRHRGILVTAECTVCKKPICPKCMESFGYFCSPLCKNKADLQGRKAPVYAGQKFEVERQFWRKTGLIFGSICVLLAALAGFWTWYSWFGSVPHKYFSVRFEDDPAYSGRVELVGKDQIIFLHGGTLARYDISHNRKVWSQELVTQQQINDGVKEQDAEEAKISAEQTGDTYRQVRTHDSIVRDVKLGLQEALMLQVSGQNVWVVNGDTMTQYDWNSGAPGKQVTLPEAGENMAEGDGELLIYGQESVTHVSLTDGEIRVDKTGATGPGRPAPAGGGNNSGGGLPSVNNPGGGPMDPQKVAEQAQNLKLQGRLALPALIGNAQHEQQLEAAERGDFDTQHRHHNSADAMVGVQDTQMVPGESGGVQFTSVLLKENIVEREAMKAPPKKSALDGDVNAAHTGEIANELLNEMQRNNGGDTVEEDHSVYRVTLHLPDGSAADWTAEVTGAPSIFPLKTVNVVAAGTSVIVLDKSNKKLWDATLTYPIPSGGGETYGLKPAYGDGPVVEHGDTLYTADQAVLSAFDLASGNARWRLPTVGVVGMFFDGDGNVYLNTTSGSLEDVRYSKQIDITKSTDDIVMKVDHQTGKTLWKITPGAFVSYVSGKFIYLTASNDPNPTDEPVLSDSLEGLQKPAFFRLRRINPKNGNTMFDYQDPLDRAPFFINFDQNTIELVFKKEVQVLHFLSL